MDTSSNVSKLPNRISWLRCCVCDSTTYTNPGRRYFRFPKDPERSKVWVAALKKASLLDVAAPILYKKYKICSDHFDDTDYASTARRYLHQSAVPKGISLSPQIKSMAEQIKVKLHSNVHETKNTVANDCCVTPKKNVSLGKRLYLNAASYVAGFVAKRASQKFSCEACASCLIAEKSLTTNSLLLHLKYPTVTKGLTYPSNELVMTICELGEKFSSLFKTVAHEQIVRKKISI